MDKDIWHLLGAGSIGCLWAARLCEKGHWVELILRNERYQSLPAEKPVTLKLQEQEKQQTFSLPVTCPAEIKSSISRLVVCTKAQDAVEAIDTIKEHLSPDSKILLLQNGMGSQQTIAAQYPHLSVWATSTTDGAYLNDAFDVCHAGMGLTRIGTLTEHCQKTDFATLLHDFGLNVEYCPDIEPVLWTKLAINCCINGLTALFNCRNGELLDNAEKQQWLNQLIKETSGVLKAWQMPVTDLQQTVYHICRVTAQNLSSTCQDARMNRNTELAYINHFLIEKAHARAIPVESHEHLMKALTEKGVSTSGC